MEIFQRMDWIHCNNCYIQPGDSDTRKFSITNCGHIFCFDCADPQETRKCLLCQAPCSNAIIGPKMSKELEIYFTEPFQIFQRMVNILQFQEKHRIRLQSFRKKQIHSLKNEILSVKERIEQSEKKMASIFEGIKKRMGVQMMEYQQATNPRQKSSSVSSAINQISINSITACCNDLSLPQSRTEPSENKRNILKRPPEGAKFFATSTPNASQCENDAFITPPSKRSGSYRGSNVLGSNSSNSDKWSPQRDPYFRKFKLPGDRGGPPGPVTALHRLNLSRQPFKVRNREVENTKYSEYFK